MRGPALRVLAILNFVAGIQFCVAATSRKEGKLSCLLPLCGLYVAFLRPPMSPSVSLLPVVGHHA